MKDESIARKYATALIQVAQETDSVGLYLKDLRYVDNMLKRLRKSREAVVFRNSSGEIKKKVLRSLFENKISNDVLNFLCLLVDREREEYLDLIAECYARIVREQENIVEAEIVCAVPPTLQMINQVKAYISQGKQKVVSLKIRVDPELIGGFVLFLGDKIMDMSILGQLSQMERKLGQKTAERYTRIIREKENMVEVEAEMVCAVPPHPEIINRIQAYLSHEKQQDVSLKVRVDPELIGGFTLLVGDRILDLSIREQLTQLEKKLRNIPITDKLTGKGE